MVLRGRVAVVEEQGIALFPGAPWLQGDEAVGTLGLALEDFAHHDAAPEMMQVLRVQAQAMAETQQMAEEVKIANQRLQRQFRAMERPEASMRAGGNGSSVGERVVELVSSVRFAAIVLDLEMPVLDSKSTAIRIREQHGPGLPLVALSGHDDAATMRA